MPGLPRKSTKKQLTKLMKKKSKKDKSNVKPRTIATYEQFVKVNENVSTLNVDDVNRILNDSKFVSLVKNIYNKLSPKRKELLNNFLSSNTINIDKIESYVKKYNIMDKVERLFSKSKDVNKVIDGISGTNEGLIGIMVAILVIAIVTFVFNSQSGGIAKLVVIILAIVALNQSGDYINKEKENIYIIKDGKKYEVELMENRGDYKVIIRDELSTLSDDMDPVDWAYHKMTPDEVEEWKNSLEEKEPSKAEKFFRPKSSVNEGKHGRIEIYGQNLGDDASVVGYAGTPEIADDLVEDFGGEFDKVWWEDTHEEEQYEV